MKFEDLLMQPSDQEKKRKVELEEEVEKLQEELDAELKLSKILKCALQGPVHSCECLSKLIPVKIQVLLAELATIEEEIVWLERKSDELKSLLHHEKKQIKDQEIAKVSRRHRKQKKLLSYGYGSKYSSRETSLSNYFEENDHYKYLRERQTSCGSSKEIVSLPAMKYSGKSLNYLQWGT